MRGTTTKGGSALWMKLHVSKNNFSKRTEECHWKGSWNQKSNARNVTSSRNRQSQHSWFSHFQSHKRCVQLEYIKGIHGSDVFLQQSNTSLSDCIDGVLSTEYIDDFQCAKCRLEHAIATLNRKLQSSSGSAKEKLRLKIQRLEKALEIEPENFPEDIEIRSSKTVPKSRIARRTRMSSYPTILAIHLSRSIYDSRSSSRKNSAKVAFPEDLQMGGIMDRQGYRLLCMITHKGGHDSGHYECFRRQIVHRPPYSTPTLKSDLATPEAPSAPVEGPTIRLVNPRESTLSVSPTTVSSDESSRPSSSDAKSTPSSSISTNANTPPSLVPDGATDNAPPINKVRKKHGNNKWWRISDEKIKETKTLDVLGMQKEVYLLFYERQRPE